MKFLWNAKDGGAESRVWCWGFESKLLGSVLLLKFGEGSREAFHTHAFNSRSWLFSGQLREDHMTGREIYYRPSPRPISTGRDTFHKVEGIDRSNWVLSLRGPWIDKWREFIPASKRHITLTHGRKEI